MERKFLLTSIFVTLGAIAFLSGYLLMPQTRQNFANQNLDGQAGFLTDRFSNKVEVGSSEDKIPNTLPLSSRKFTTFIQPFSDSKKIVAITNTGDIIEIDTTNLTEKILYNSQAGIIEAMLSPAGNSVIYSFYNAQNNRKWVYHNLKTGELSEIESNLKSATFSPQGDQAAYLIVNDEGGEILISKNGKVIKRALKTRIGIATISWPSNDFISIISYDKGGYGDLFTLKENGVLNKVLSYQYDLNVKWLSESEKIIFSAKDDTGSTQLFYKDIKNNSTIAALEVSTNASKCVWADEENVVCGITDKTQIKDEFYKVNITDGSKTLVATPNINLLVRELSLSRSGGTIFVLNDIDNKLYVLKTGQ